MLQANHCRHYSANVIVVFKAKYHQHDGQHNHRHLSQLWMSQANGWQAPAMRA
jgi:hypothetical protein